MTTSQDRTDDAMLTRFINRVRQIRKWRGLSQQDLAAQAGISANVVANLESLRRKDVRLTDAVRICAALDVDLARMTSTNPLTVPGQALNV